MDILGGNPVGQADTGSGNNNNNNQALSGLNQAQLLNSLAPGLFNTNTAPQNYNSLQAGQNMLNSSFNLLGLFAPQTFSNSFMQAPQMTQPFGAQGIPPAPAPTPAPAPPAAAPAPAPAPAPPAMETVVGQYSQAPAGWINEGAATPGNSWGAYKYSVPQGTALPPGFSVWNGP